MSAVSMNLVVAFEVADDDRRTALENAIKTLGHWAILTSGARLVVTNESPARILEQLHPLVQPSDSLWVFTAAMPWAAHGNPEAEDLAVVSLGPFEDWTDPR